MPAYSFVDSVYFKNIVYQPEIHHRVFILNQVTDMYIILPLNFLVQTIVSFPILFV